MIKCCFFLSKRLVISRIEKCKEPGPNRVFEPRLMAASSEKPQPAQLYMRKKTATTVTRSFLPHPFMTCRTKAGKKTRTKFEYYTVLPNKAIVYLRSLSCLVRLPFHQRPVRTHHRIIALLSNRHLISSSSCLHGPFFIATHIGL